MPHRRRRTARYLRIERQRRGWLMREVAAFCGVHESTVHGWETGRCGPRKVAAERLSRMFDMPLGVLMSEGGDYLAAAPCANTLNRDAGATHAYPDCKGR